MLANHYTYDYIIKRKEKNGFNFKIQISTNSLETGSGKENDRQTFVCRWEANSNKL